MRVATSLGYTLHRHPNASAEISSRMRSPFYQANFCAECGNRLEPRFRPGPQYFCGECAVLLRRRKIVTPLAILLFGASLIVFAFNYKYSGNQSRKVNSITSEPSASALDSVVNPALKQQAQRPAKVFCGARTRRGTPCRHLVQPGQRCAQHRGMPSLLEDTPQKNPTPQNSELR